MERLGQEVVGIDVRTGPGVIEMDVRDPGLVDLIRTERIDAVVHLAAVVEPRAGDTRETLYSIDVEGTANVLSACAATGVDHLTVTSSGAAYGYHPDNPAWISEDAPPRGNEEFAYADHKRLVEEMLEAARENDPAIGQLILRPGTILGPGLMNQITRLFTRKVIPGVAGARSPFVFIWIDDVVEIIIRGVAQRTTGVYNVAGDGAVELSEIARIMGRPFLRFPSWVLRAGLGTLKRLRLSPYGSEQVVFLAYRPVLDNRRLKEEFGYVPRLTSIEAFMEWKSSL